jgi:hypothetical protein
MRIGPENFLVASPSLFAADVWIPASVYSNLAPELAGDALKRRDAAMFQVVGRLKPGVTPARAEAALDAVARQVERDFGDSARDRGGRRVSLVPRGKMLPIRRRDRPFFIEVLMLLAGLALLMLAPT